MSILIKGMAMPKNCIYCPMAHWNKLDEITGCEIVIGKKYIDKDDKDYWYGSDIPSWCPLVEIPRHGRLIDADKLKADNPMHMNADVPYVTEVTVEEIIDEAPTIIEGEEECSR